MAHWRLFFGNRVSQSTGTYTYAASGQLSISGAASVVKGKTFLASGQHTISGAALLAKGNVFAASGQFAVTGAATTNTSTLRAYSASGQHSISGFALLEKVKAFAASGQHSISGAGTTGYTSAGPTMVRPVSDLLQGDWLPSTGSDLYAMVDESSPADADYVYTNTPGALSRMRMGTHSDPGVDTGHKLRARVPASFSPSGSLTVRLKHGATLVAERTEASPIADTTYEYNLTTGEVANITDRSLLDLELEETS
jgi:hypothetical protein